METLYAVTRKIRQCKTCSAKCDMGSPIVGCESIVVPMPLLEARGKTCYSFCVRRTWFDENCYPVDYYRWPATEEEFNMPEKRWETKLAEELKKIQAEANKR